MTYSKEGAYRDLLMVRRKFNMTDFDTGPGTAVDRLYKAACKAIDLQEEIDAEHEAHQNGCIPNAKRLEGALREVRTFFEDEDHCAQVIDRALGGN